jgi:ribosomal protein S30
MTKAIAGRDDETDRIDLSVLQLALDVDLSLRDVPRQVRDGVRDVVVGHGKDGELRDGPLAVFYATGALVDGGQVRVHVPRVPAPPRHLLPRRRHLVDSHSSIPRRPSQSAESRNLN